MDKIYVQTPRRFPEDFGNMVSKDRTGTLYPGECIVDNKQGSSWHGKQSVKDTPGNQPAKTEAECWKICNEKFPLSYGCQFHSSANYCEVVYLPIKGKRTY